MADSVYRVTEVIGVSSESWEAAARNAVETAARTVRDLRLAEAVRGDVTIENGAISSFRVRLSISVKYESGDEVFLTAAADGITLDRAVPSYPAKPDLRASDADREAAVGRLRTAALEGRLDHDELEGRLASAYGARTCAELTALTADGIPPPDPLGLLPPGPPPLHS